MLPLVKKEFSILDYWDILKKRKWVIITSFLSLFFLVAIFTFRMTPIYRSTAIILIEREPPKVTPGRNLYSYRAIDREFYATQYNILKSRSLAKRVFEELNLYIDPEFSDLEDSIGSFLRSVTVEPVKNSKLVELSFEGADPNKITKITNTIAAQYIKQDVENAAEVSRKAVSWLLEQVESLKERVKESETELQEFREEQQIVATPESRREMTSLIEDLRKKEAGLETNLSELAEKYGKKHPNIIMLKSELASVRKKLETETKRAIMMGQVAIQFNVLKREVESNKQLYNALLQKAKETGIAEDLKISQIRIVDVAEIPKSPIKPEKGKNLMLGCLMGLVLGITLAVSLEYMDNTLKSPEDVEECIDLPFLGYIPSNKKDAKADAETDLLVHQHSKSAISEAYRGIRTAMMFAFADKPSKSVLVTSSAPREGKTTVSINLATIMAQAGNEVLLVDADMRCPRVHKTFNVEISDGLSEILAGKANLDSAIKQTDIPNLKLLTCGSLPPNPAELLGTKRMQELLGEMVSKFNKVIIDSPPIVSVADSSILANIVDGVAFIVQSGKTSIEVILRGKQKLLNAKANVLGVTLNNVDMARENYYYYYYYSPDKETKKA